MNDDEQSAGDENDAIPTLNVMVDDGGDDFATRAESEPLAALAPLVERIAARIDRQLEQDFERTVTAPLNEALAQALSSYQQQVRVVLLHELLQQLGGDTEPADQE